jgi:hypothetical protein
MPLMVAFDIRLAAEHPDIAASFAAKQVKEVIRVYDPATISRQRFLEAVEPFFARFIDAGLMD